MTRNSTFDLFQTKGLENTTDCVRTLKDNTKRALADFLANFVVATNDAIV